MNSERSEWQNDWTAFTSYLEVQLRNGATEDDLANCFGGCEVRWAGEIEEIDIDDLAAFVNVLLVERSIKLQNDAVVLLDGLALVVSERSTEKWESRRVGETVTFTAILGAAGSPFPPIQVTTLRSGKTVIMIQATNAQPV